MYRENSRGIKMIKKERFDFVWNLREYTNDENIIHEVFTDESYDLTYIKENVITVVDIGAHIGSFSVKMKRSYPSCKIWSYELLEENYELFKLNLKEFNNVVSHNKPVSGDRKPLNIEKDYGKLNTGGTILSYGFGENTLGSIDIREIQKEVPYIDVLKLDCEGGENSIFENLDFTRVNYLYCELHIYSNLIGMDETVELSCHHLWPEL